MKYTPWISGAVKPVHVGVYERQTNGSNRMTTNSYWDGKQWCQNHPRHETAAGNIQTSAFQNTMKWRGLAEKP